MRYQRPAELAEAVHKQYTPSKTDLRETFIGLNDLPERLHIKQKSRERERGN